MSQLIAENCFAGGTTVLCPAYKIKGCREIRTALLSVVRLTAHVSNG